MSEAAKKYLVYLGKYSKTYHVEMAEAHSHIIPRSVAEEYGVTGNEMSEIEKQLN
jgi:hypothetical protein